VSRRSPQQVVDVRLRDLDVERPYRRGARGLSAVTDMIWISSSVLVQRKALSVSPRVAPV
jgi:hypothetical protein